MTIILQFVVGVIAICIASVSFFVLYCTLVEIGGRIDSKARDDNERFLVSLIALLAVVLFVSLAMVIGGVVIPFLGMKG